jgi:SAM-dependent methyltransferase
MRYQEENAETISRWCRQGWKWGVPLTHEEYLKARKGTFAMLLTPTKPIPHKWLKGIRGKKVLGLASGGGQQMPILAALGAQCTVLDYSDEQLKKEKEVAEREGYAIEIVKADMTKKLPFAAEAFDFVINPVSLVYIEKEIPVFKEVHRILKNRGIFLTGLDNGMNFITDDDRTITNSLPFNPLKDRKLREKLKKDDDGIQFSHSLEESIGGLVRNGFVIKDFFDDTNDEGNLMELNIPSFFAVYSIKE